MSFPVRLPAARRKIDYAFRTKVIGKMQSWLAPAPPQVEAWCTPWSAPEWGNTLGGGARAGTCLDLTRITCWVKCRRRTISRLQLILIMVMILLRAWTELDKKFGGALRTVKQYKDQANDIVLENMPVGRPFLLVLLLLLLLLLNPTFDYIFIGLKTFINESIENPEYDMIKKNRMKELEVEGKKIPATDLITFTSTKKDATLEEKIAAMPQTLVELNAPGGLEAQATAEKAIIEQAITDTVERVKAYISPLRKSGEDGK